VRNKNVLAKTEGEEGSLTIKGPDGEEAKADRELGRKKGSAGYYYDVSAMHVNSRPYYIHTFTA